MIAVRGTASYAAAAAAVLVEDCTRGAGKVESTKARTIMTCINKQAVYLMTAV
jgi:hypothetical protein